MSVKVGTCGWSVKGGRKAYFEVFKVIELQETFYKLPLAETARRWREDAPPNFEFIVKAWQAITHPPSSPTWRKSGLKVDSGKAENYGYLKPTNENIEAWGRILEICRALNAKICIIQTPPSFSFSEENVENMLTFFSRIERGDLVIGWEPRGEWNEKLNVVGEICRRLNLIHVVDPFRRMPAHYGKICYFRLHGIGGGEVNYKYKYRVEDLVMLKRVVENLARKGVEVYVMFNNVYMAADAREFMKLLEV
jgi:uncharacterized protein YecE (DUF72 family)